MTTANKPKIDRTAADLHPTQGAVPPAPAGRDARLDPIEDEGPETAFSDVAENHPGYVYTPKAGVVSTDVVEVALMLMLQLVANHIGIQPGALRRQIMTAQKFEALSPEAQRHMSPLAVQPLPEPTQET